MLKKHIESIASKRSIDEQKKREAISVLGGVVGIVCNVVLCLFKFLIGYLTNSVSITADAVNNLTDAGSNVVSIAGAKMSNKPVDKEHPFGHGRMEYISALAVAFLIFLMGFELAKSSIEKIADPQPLNFNIWYPVVLAVAAGVKFWLAYFNHVLYKITGNINMKAVKKDCMNDGISTLATMIALLVSEFTGLKMIDGAMGLAVSVIIILAGVDIVKDIMGPLLGQAPSKELVERIEEMIVSKDNIIGIHDLIVHDYGPGRRIGSVHAEVPADIDLIEIHDIIDNIEIGILDELGILMCIHIDPLVLGDEKINSYKELTREIIDSLGKGYTFHDFRMVEGPTHTNLLFDLVVPAQERGVKDSEILSQLRAEFKLRDKKINVVARIEHSYV